MRKLGRKVLSVLLVLCLAVSMAVMAMPSASAGVGTAIAKAVGEKALELGMRAVCKASTELASQAEDDDASIVVNSIINFLILDSQGSSISKISAMCEDILVEIAELSEDVQVYTATISSSIDKMNVANAKEQFSDQWKEDIQNVIYSPSANQPSIGAAFDVYIKYFISATLNSDPALLNSSFYNTAAGFWSDHFKEEMPSDIHTDEQLSTLRTKLEEEFIKIQSITSTESAKDTVYKSANVYMVFYTTLNKLVDNYFANSSETYSVVDCAATDAYYALPFAHQQRGFIETIAKRQIMITTFVQMCFAEYLSMQSEYLEENVGGNWRTEFALPYRDNASMIENINYSECASNFADMVNNNLNEATKLLEARFKINPTAYTGSPVDITVGLSDYMQPEDATKVYLNVNDYESDYDYNTEIHSTEADDSMKLGNTVKRANRIPEELVFSRIMAGDTSKSVYYILDPTQFEDGDHNALDAAYLNEHIKRYGPLGGSDKLYGDLYPVSVDYRNMTKSMSDGVNSFKVPSSGSLDAYASLFTVPYLSAYSEFSIQDYLGHYLPQANNVYMLTSSYTNNWNTGINTEVKKADITVVNVSSNVALENTYELNTQDITPQDISWDSDVYTAILSNTDDSFKQKVSLSLDDDYNIIDNFYIDSEKGDFPIYASEGSGVAEGGQKLTLRFKVDDVYCFDTLTMVRHNAEDTAKLLLDREDLMNNMTVDEDGYYSFDVEMPYSDTEFIIRSKKSDHPKATVKIIDNGDDAVFSFRMLYDGNTYYDGYSTYVNAGDDVELRFRINNISQFMGVYAINESTSEVTTLVDKDDLSNMTPDQTLWYSIITKMGNNDTEFCIVAEAPEEFTPGDIETDENGTFIIRTYEDLRSMAYYINNNNSEYMNGDYILANDINVMNRPLEPIGYGDAGFNGAGKKQFYGTFDGQGYTISNFKIVSNNSYKVASLFGFVYGEIKNLNLAGDYTAYAAGDYFDANMAGLAYKVMETGKVQNIKTNLTYKTELFTSVSGVSGIANAVSEGSVVDKCFVDDTVYFPDYTPIYSGIFSNSSSNKTLKITNCANISTVTLGADSKNVNGLAEGATYASYIFENCYSAVTYNGDNLVPVMKDTYNRNVTATNCYYLDTSVGENSICTEYGKAVTIDQFESGEVAYCLNNGEVSGSQVWYQNLDNGETPDTYPLFEGGTVYLSFGTCISSSTGFTNIPGTVTHNYNKYHVCKDCISLRPGEAAGIYGFSIGLGGNISVQYYMVIDEKVAADETAKMVFTVPDTGAAYQVEIPVSEATKTQFTVPATGQTRTLYVFECEVAAKEMTSEIYCQVVTETNRSDEFYYTVKDYAEVILANPQSFEKEIPLVKAMLNYGAYAQLSFDYNYDNLANTSVYISEEEKLLAPADFSSYGYTLEGEEEAIRYYGSAISLKSETAIKHYFYFENEEDVENTVVTVNGVKVTPVKNGGYYEVKVADIPAHRLNENYEVKVGNITLNYSAFSYCNIATANATNQALVDVANALYAYNQAAINYIK